MTALTNYHTHTDYCDGKAEPEAFIKSAVERGFAALGFSAHAPVPQHESWTLSKDRAGDYLTRIDELRKKYSGQIEIYSGMEFDYIQGVLGPPSPKIAGYNLDYSLGGIHIIPIDSTGEYPCIDGPVDEFERMLHLQFGGDRKALAEYYFTLIGDMIKEHRFNILAHFDLVKVRNRGEEHYKEKEEWYRKAVCSALDTAADSDVILEINTGGVSRGKSDTFYPSLWILEEARGRDISITINSDVHVPEDIDAMFVEAADTARAAGYTEKRVLLAGRWQDIPL